MHFRAQNLVSTQTAKPPNLIPRQIFQLYGNMQYSKWHSQAKCVVLFSPDFLQRDLGIQSLKAYFEDEDQDRVDSFEQELMQIKINYYKEKMGFTDVDDAVLAEQAKCFVVGIQWILHYYYTGVPSWSW